MARRKLDLADAIRAALAKPEASRLATALEHWDDKELTLADADGLVAVLAEITDVKPLVADHDGENFLDHLARLFQSDAADAATLALRDRGLPQLARLFDAAMAVPDCPAAPLLTVCTAFALYSYRPGVGRVAAAVRRFPDEDMWEVVFGLYAEENHPHGPELATRLRDPLPDDFAAVALLDLSNALARPGRLTAHPYDTPAGRERLEAWLAEPDAAPFGCAPAAAEALTFIDPPTEEPR